MDMNATLIIQMLVFILFIWITMRYVWPPITKALAERQKKIADGLAAAEEGHRILEIAKTDATEALMAAKTQAARIIEQSNQRAANIIEEAKIKAREEGDRLLQIAKSEIDQEYNSAKEKLLKQVADLAIAGAERILQREVDHAANDRLVAELANEIE